MAIGDPMPCPSCGALGVGQCPWCRNIPWAQPRSLSENDRLVQAIRDGVQDGMAPLRDLVQQLETLFAKIHAVAEALEKRENDGL